MRDIKGLLSGIGSALLAFVPNAGGVLALVFAGTGVLSGGLAAGLAAYRIYFLPLSLFFLGFGFHFHYVKRRGPRWHRWLLWGSALLLLFFWLAPLLLLWWAGAKMNTRFPMPQKRDENGQVRFVGEPRFTCVLGRVDPNVFFNLAKRRDGQGRFCDFGRHKAPNQRPGNARNTISSQGKRAKGEAAAPSTSQLNRKGELSELRTSHKGTSSTRS